MGMFDTVHFLCPNCKSRIEEQSKSGICKLKNYGQSNVPIDVAGSLLGIEVICKSCNKRFLINGNPCRIPLTLVSIDGELYD